MPKKRKEFFDDDELTNKKQSEEEESEETLLNVGEDAEVVTEDETTGAEFDRAQRVKIDKDGQETITAAPRPADLTDPTVKEATRAFNPGFVIRKRINDEV